MICACGGIGRHDRFRIYFPTKCRFKSCQAHQRKILPCGGFFVGLLIGISEPNLLKNASISRILHRNNACKALFCADVQVLSGAPTKKELLSTKSSFFVYPSRRRQAFGLIYHPTQVGISSRARCALVSHHASACIFPAA